MGLGMAVQQMWNRVTGVQAGGSDEGQRKTTATPLAAGSLFSPLRLGTGQPALPKPTAANLRRFAETPVARRAINSIKDRIACMDWRIEPHACAADTDLAELASRRAALTRALQAPNPADSFRTLIEQVIEDTLVGGFGAAEIEATGDPALPVRLYPVDGASIQVNAHWSGQPGDPRYGQLTGRLGTDAVTPLRDDELMYVRLNPRSHTVFGLGKMEVAFESISSFLQAHRYAGRLASNSVVQYALWLNERTPEQHERLIRWWQDEVEGTGRVPVISSEQKPEVLRFAGGTDAELRLQWQQFLVTMVANAFDLPAMLLGIEQDVNRSTAQALQDQAFQDAVVPLARLLAGHITRDVIQKRLGWHDLRFTWSDLETRDEMNELEIQTRLLAAGVVTVAEVRQQRGLPPLAAASRRRSPAQQQAAGAAQQQVRR